MHQFLLDFLFPRTSLTGQEGEWITAYERSQLKSFPVVLTGDALKQRGVRALDRIYAASSYAALPLLRKAVHTFKYGRVPDLAEDLAALMIDSAPIVSALDAPVLCPVPLHWTRQAQRGFNQAELLAQEIAKVLPVPVRSLLKRRRPTGHQAWRSREERLSALQDAFRISVSEMPRFVILIDDLSTTGATLEACARELKRAGAKRVEGWVVAQG